jgi:hypothetical protein
MSRMLELVRQQQVPEPVLRSLAAGTMPLARVEQLEILVELTRDPRVGATAAQTLAGWSSDELRNVAADPQTPRAVLDYFLEPSHRRPDVMLPLISNPSVTDSAIAAVAETATRDQLQAMLGSERVLQSSTILIVLAGNTELQPAEREMVKQRLTQMGQELEAGGSASDPELAAYLLEHGADLAANQDKALELHDVTDEEKAVAAGKAPPADEKQSVIQKLAAMSVGKRVQQAFKGNREERMVLIRDGARIVALAVLESPKVTDAEVESFAAMKNVAEDVLRGIARKRKFMKNYSVIRALINNPRTPLDLGLQLLPHMTSNDLRLISVNKNVGDTLRKVATKFFRDKTGNK